MWKTITSPFRALWETKFETPLALNLFVCAITYVVLWVYCVLCLYNIDSTFLNKAGEINETAKELYVAQFYVDAFFPSTLTLVISIIVQNMIEGFKSRGARWSFTAIVIMATMLYTMVCCSLRTFLSLRKFALFTSVLVVLCFISIVQIHYSLRQDLGISGEV